MNQRVVESTLVRHDVENHVVGLVHTILAETAEVMDGAVNIALAEAVGAVHHAVVHRQFGTDECAIKAYTHL